MSDQSSEHEKPLQPEQFEKYYFIVGSKTAAKRLMKKGITASPEGVSETPDEKRAQQRPYGAYGTQSIHELRKSHREGKHIVETNIPTSWIQSSYGTDTYSVQDIPPSYVTRHIPPKDKA